MNSESWGKCLSIGKKVEGHVRPRLWAFLKEHGFVFGLGSTSLGKCPTTGFTRGRVTMAGATSASACLRLAPAAGPSLCSADPGKGPALVAAHLLRSPRAAADAATAFASANRGKVVFLTRVHYKDLSAPPSLYVADDDRPLGTLLAYCDSGRSGCKGSVTPYDGSSLLQHLSRDTKTGQDWAARHLRVPTDTAGSSLPLAAWLQRRGFALNCIRTACPFSGTIIGRVTTTLPADQCEGRGSPAAASRKRPAAASTEVISDLESPGANTKTDEDPPRELASPPSKGLRREDLCRNPGPAAASAR